MTERPKFFDDLAGVAGGAISALAGVREELAALARSRVDEAVKRLDLVRRDEFDAIAELAQRAALTQQISDRQREIADAQTVAWLEQEARQLGYIFPGEQLYVIVPPGAARASTGGVSAAIPTYKAPATPTAAPTATPKPSASPSPRASPTPTPAPH